jgi:hypothetical protein
MKEDKAMKNATLRAENWYEKKEQELDRGEKVDGPRPKKGI